MVQQRKSKVTAHGERLKQEEQAKHAVLPVSNVRHELLTAR